MEAPVQSCFTWNNAEEPVTQRIAIANQKGGVGKTTTAINLSVALALAGRRVLLVDLDAQANATSGVGAELAPNDASHPLLQTNEGTVKPQATQVPGLTILPSSLGLVNADRELSRHADGTTRLAAYLTRNPLNVHFVVIDCPPSLGLLTTNGLNAATGLLIPIQCEYYAMEGLTRILDALQEIRQSSNRSLELAGIVLTMFDDSLELSHEVVSEVRGYFADKVYETVIPRDVALSEAASYGQSVFRYGPRGPGALAYLELAKEGMSNG